MSSVRAIELRLIGLPLVHPFRTSFGTSTEKVCVLVRLETDDAEGWGECVADIEPGYSEEFNDGAWLVLRDHLGARPVSGRRHRRSTDLEACSRIVRGNPMAKAALIDAFVDAELRARSVSLATWLGGVRARVACGVSIGIADTTEALLEQVDGYLDQGYQRIKLKIEPGTRRRACARLCAPPTPTSRSASTRTPRTRSTTSTCSGPSTATSC